MKQTAEINELSVESNKCEHCNRTFIRSSTILKHLCEQKRRWMDRDRPVNRMAYGAWVKFYTVFQPGKRKVSHTDFITSAYYSAFIKFGSYCIQVKTVSPVSYVEYLIKNSVPIDNWASDRTYTKYLIDYLRVENCLDAVKRSLENMLDIVQAENIQLSDFFRLISGNRICHMITAGHISPWVLYQSKTGLTFLSNLNDEQRGIVFNYVDPERWAIKFKREPENVDEVKSVLAGVSGL